MSPTFEIAAVGSHNFIKLEVEMLEAGATGINCWEDVTLKSGSFCCGLQRTYINVLKKILFKGVVKYVY